MLSDYVLALVRDAWPKVITVLEKPWETPEAMSHEIQALLQSSTYWAEEILLRIDVAGSPDQHILCMIGNDQVMFCSPQRDASLMAHPFVRELVEERDICFEQYVLSPAGVCLTTPLSVHLEARLALPSVLLVSLFHPEMYPAARLTLGISYLASYLRRHYVARVELIDCQLGPNVADVVKRVCQVHPDILGVSVNFGQFDLMEQLLV